MTDFIEIQANKHSISTRRPVYGVGINNAWYMTQVTIEGKKCRCTYYKTWHSMLTRCYNDKHHKKQPRYKDCSVCTDWLLFSNFSAWMKD